MPDQHQGKGQNQTLLELIYALKSLAQTVEFHHQDLVRRLEEEAKARHRDLTRIQDVIGKNNQSLAVLPITLSDRVEKLLTKLETEIESKIDEVASSIEDVRRSLNEYTRTTERAISQNELNAAVEAVKDEKADITGKIEVTDKGDIKLQFNSRLIGKLKWGVLIAAIGGGTLGIKEILEFLFG